MVFATRGQEVTREVHHVVLAIINGRCVRATGADEPINLLHIHLRYELLQRLLEPAQVNS